ncbi:MAG: YbaB/EbfC family nucleoid-associated protein [Aphanocapsa lilacina HA4352-LM1]|jgi:DNA-binding YbaB/EbfC family protein|nr:YbaB/EbfC family nucleoid-associated protein [Aphanocapsa lilacina HA4352-LM1]
MSKGFGPMGQFQEALKRVKQIQEGSAKLQDELAALSIEGVAGGGLVKVTLSGNQEPTSVTIDPQLLSESKEVVEDLLLTAYKDAYTKSAETMRAKMQELTGGMEFPPGLGF